MWLLETETGELTWFNSPDEVPSGYAILSHVWGPSEQSFQDIQALHARHAAPTLAPALEPHGGMGAGEGHIADEHPSFATLPRPQQQRLLGGPPGSVGPFGTYKKSPVGGARVG